MDQLSKAMKGKTSREDLRKFLREQRKKDRLEWFPHVWKVSTRWATPVLCTGIVLVIVSILFIAFQKALLLAAGTAMLAAGLTIITTTLTGKEATRQQFAKEANIIRKDTIYGPLFIELKRIYECLDEAHGGEGPYPHYIFGAGGEPERSGYARNMSYPTFLDWPQFQQDYRVDSFKPKTRALLGETQWLIEQYNRAVEDTMEPAVAALAPVLERAISAWINGEEYRDWDTRSSGGTIWQNDPLHQWNNYLHIQVVSTNDYSALAINMAKLWLGQYGGLGWFLTEKTHETALQIDNGYQTLGGGVPVRPDIIWFEIVIAKALSTFVQIERDEIDIYEFTILKKYDKERAKELIKVHKISKQLQDKIEEIKDLLEAGIRFIRDQYEGGEPPV